ncbi:regulator of MON1-CCZ1 complex-like isoform X1 [Salvia splendens]|uniref:regulator of MON1-CCZ1 complex-like isoform X1 n=2 Tax=Salvia splendens TaxID=180675 RepID=UPI001C2723F4|nr:regulator of MON1-CCZ1 complex-like isoform X1 [Salvia splendens]XP_041991014.1 regulator of MON1-CCZ1 complex-like isoform X1 [Salvia splendens]
MTYQASDKPSIFLGDNLKNVNLHNMTGESSSSALSYSSGSNALSHVYIQYPPLRCHVPASRSLFYDDGNKLILALTPNQVFSWKTATYNPYAAPSSDQISEGPVLSIRYSLDLKLLAIQRSSHEIQIWNKDTGDTFSQKCRPESESILGFFWTDCPTCDIVFVKTSGLDLYTYGTESRNLQLVQTKKQSISWYIYTHESRLVLLASGMQCKSFTGFQLSSAGIIRLPKFEMVMAKPEANSNPILAAEDVHIITVYGRLYCLQFDKVAMLLRLYRFYRDAVVQQGSLPVYSDRIAVSVVDNVLLVHQAEAKVVIVYDIYADSKVPISAPLPLCLRGYSRASVASFHTSTKTSGASESKNLSATEETIYGDQWQFLVPDLVLDVSNGSLWKISLDLEGISASSSEVQLILEFLQRRKLDAEKAKQLSLAIVRTIILERKPVPMVARAMDVLLAAYSQAIKTGSYNKRSITEEISPSNAPNAAVGETITGTDVSRSINQEPKSVTQKDSSNRSIVATSESDGSIEKTETGDLLEPGLLGGEDLPAGTSQTHGPTNNQLNSSATQRKQSAVTSSAATSPADFYSHVFSPIVEEMMGDGSYLTAIIAEFLRSCSLEKLKVYPNTYVLLVQILARDERYAELELFIMNKIIEHSKEVALQLLDSGRQNQQIRKLGQDILRQLSLHHDYVLLLVQDGYYLEALRYARKNKVTTVRPSLFLEAAYVSKDPQHLAAVLRFFSDFIPGFKSSPDHNTYHRFVAELNSSVTG